MQFKSDIKREQETHQVTSEAGEFCALHIS